MRIKQIEASLVKLKKRQDKLKEEVDINARRIRLNEALLVLTKEEK